MVVLAANCVCICGDVRGFNGLVLLFAAKYCKQLYLDVTSTNHGKITWSQIKPIIQGRILYGPDTEHTREIMTYVSLFIKEINDLRNT